MVKRIAALLLVLALLGCTGCSLLKRGDNGTNLGKTLLKGLNTAPEPVATEETGQPQQQDSTRMNWMLKPDAMLAADYQPNASEYSADGSFVETFLYDGMVEVQFCAFAGKTDAQSALEAAAVVTGANVTQMRRERIYINNQEALLLRYTVGNNEDMYWCEDVLTLAQEGSMLFHTATPVDRWEDYSGQVEAWVEGLRVINQPAQSPYIKTQEPPYESLETVLVDWWVYAGRDADPEYPVLIHFDYDGTLYMNPVDCAAAQAGEDVPANRWEIRGGVAVCTITEDANTFESRVEWGDAGEIYLCAPDGAMYRYFKCTSEEGAAMLRGTAYERYGVEPGLYAVLFGLEPEGWGMTLLVDDLVWVWSDDEVRKRQYGLENAEFLDDYEIVNEDPSFEPVMVMLDGSAEFRLIDWEDGSPLAVQTVTPEQFAECMYANHREEPMLAQLKIMDEYVIEVQEIYTP